MTASGPLSQERLQARLDAILNLLHKHRLVESLLVQQHPAPRQALVENLVHRQQLTELRLKLSQLNSAEIAHLLEMLPPEERQLVWAQVPDEVAGEVLWELSVPVAETLVQMTERTRLLALCQQMDTDDLGQIADYLPEDVLQEVSRSLDSGERDWLASSIAYPEDSVGELMSSERVAVRDTATVKQVIESLRQRDGFPEQTDKLFVVDARQRLKGTLALTTLLLHDPAQLIAAIMTTEVISFTPTDKAAAAAQTFERYDLVSAPVVDERGKLLGRLTVDTVMDFVREKAEEDALRREGLSGDADLFAPVWRSARSRWLWLGVNLITAFIASRVIGLFAGAIEQLVALATLMPIVASVGGNTGNQTIALFIRGFALEQINSSNLRYLALKELGVSVLNGLLWGSVMGLIAFALYGNPALGLVMATAMFLNLIVAAFIGISVPLVLRKLGRDPVMGASVLLTFMTDSMGFFIFLGLAAVVLLP